MIESKFKTKDMVIAIFCTLLAVLTIVFYFLPFFNIKHTMDPDINVNYEQIYYSGWDLTRAVFTNARLVGTKLEGLVLIKETYVFAVLLAGILMPLSIICNICTAVFSYFSWLKNEDYKKYCFMFSLVAMMFATLTLVGTWFLAIVIKDGNDFGIFNHNIKASMSYASFVSLILAFVIAIIACAYNYFLDNFDPDEEDEYEDEDEDDEDDEEDFVETRKKKVITTEVKPDGSVKKSMTETTTKSTKPKTSASNTKKSNK